MRLKTRSCEHVEVAGDSGVEQTRNINPETQEEMDAKNLDRFGAVRELGPVERRLVKKLDWYIMPT